MGDSMYYYGNYWDESTMSNQISFGILDITSLTHYPLSLTHYPNTPYGIQVNPYNGDIYVTDAKNYVSSGQLHCYSRDGKRKWSVRTGDIPAHMCFVYR